MVDDRRFQAQELTGEYSAEEKPDGTLFKIQSQQAQDQGALMFAEQFGAEVVNEIDQAVDEPESDH